MARFAFLLTLLISVKANALTVELYGVRGVHLHYADGTKSVISFDSETAGKFSGYICQTLNEEQKSEIHSAISDADLKGKPLNLKLTVGPGTMCLQSVSLSESES